MEGRLVSPLKRGTSTDQDLSALAGNEYDFVDTQFNTNRLCRMVLVKNGSTIALAARKLVRWKTSGDYHTVVDGYTKVEAEDWAGVTDDLLSATVPVNSYFYIGVKGPFLVLTPATAAEAGPVDFAVGLKVVAATAAASTATTDAGAVRTRNATLGATGTALANNIENAVGRAASAKATTSTGTPLLVIFGD